MGRGYDSFRTGAKARGTNHAIRGLEISATPHPTHTHTYQPWGKGEELGIELRQRFNNPGAQGSFPGW